MQNKAGLGNSQWGAIVEEVAKGARRRCHLTRNLTQVLTEMRGQPCKHAEVCPQQRKKHRSLRWWCTWRLLEQASGWLEWTVWDEERAGEGSQRGHERPGWAVPYGHCKNLVLYSRHSGSLGFILLAKSRRRFGSKSATEQYDVSCCFRSVVFQSEDHKEIFHRGIVFHSGKQGMVGLKWE